MKRATSGGEEANVHVLITTQRQTRRAMEAARTLNRAGLDVLVWTPSNTIPRGWKPRQAGAEPSDEVLTVSAVQYVAGRDPGSGLILLPLDMGWKAGDALRVAADMAQHPGALVLAGRTGRLPAGEHLASRVFGLIQGVNVRDLYAGLAGWPPALVAELAKPSRIPVFTRAMIAARELDLSVEQPSFTPSAPSPPPRTAGRLALDLACFLAVFIRFAASSILSFGLDYGLCILLFLPLTGSKTVANVAARVFSSTFNFTLNRTIVFQGRRSNRTPIRQALARYYLLAAVIAAASTGMIYLFSTVCGFNVRIVKPLVDLALYFISFAVQRELVYFKNGRLAPRRTAGER
jgi:putative flippase GtrA